MQRKLQRLQHERTTKTLIHQPPNNGRNRSAGLERHSRRRRLARPLGRTRRLRVQRRRREPPRGLVVDYDDDLAELCARLSAERRKRCSVVFCPPRRVRRLAGIARSPRRSTRRRRIPWDELRLLEGDRLVDSGAPVGLAPLRSLTAFHGPPPAERVAHAPFASARTGRRPRPARYGSSPAHDEPAACPGHQLPAVLPLEDQQVTLDDPPESGRPARASGSRRSPACRSGRGACSRTAAIARPRRRSPPRGSGPAFGF